MGGFNSGRGGLPVAKITRIRELVREGIPKRKIAVSLGVDRKTVRKYAASIPSKPRQPGRKKSAQRCPKCGAVVRMPCLACSLR